GWVKPDRGGRFSAVAPSRPCNFTGSRMAGDGMRLGGDFDQRRRQPRGCPGHHRSRGGERARHANSLRPVDTLRSRRGGGDVLAATPARIGTKIDIRTGRGVLTMKRLGLTTAVAILFALSALSGDSAFAQSTAEQQNELKAQIERRFDVVPLRGSVLLKPKDERGYRSIDLTDASIAIDGAPATGPELRDKLGADADLVLRLSYLEPEARQRLFQPTVPTVEAPPGVPPPPPLPVERDRRFGRRGRDGGDRIRFGGSVVVRADEVVDGDVV